jgi:hypothetical protein
MYLKKDKAFVRFTSEVLDFLSDIVFLETNSVSSDLRQIFKILRQKMNFVKQNGRLTQHKRFAIAHPNICLAKTFFMLGTLDEIADSF